MMNPFLPLFCCAAALLTTSVAHAKPKPLEASKDNFVSLYWSRSGGFAGISERYTIQNHEIIKNSFGNSGVGGTAPYSPPQVAPLSENQWKELLAQLKTVNVPAIAGTYRQPLLSDGFNETLRLTLSDDADLDQTFSVSNYGDKAPAPYYKFTAYLTALLRSKFNPTPASTPTIPTK